MRVVADGLAATAGNAAIVESENPLHDVREIHGNVNPADAAAIVSAGVGIVEELDLEGCFHGGNGTSHSDAASGGAGSNQREAECAKGLDDFIDIGLSGAVGVAQLIASQDLVWTPGDGWKSGFAAKLESYLDGGVGIGPARGDSTRQWFAITTQDGRMGVRQDAPPTERLLTTGRK